MKTTYRTIKTKRALKTTILILTLVMLLVSACGKKSTVPPPVPWETLTTSENTQVSPTTTLGAAAVPTVTTQAPEQATPTSEPPTTAPQEATPTATASQEATPTATAPQEATPTTAAPQPAWGSMTSPDYGIQAFMWWRPEVATRDLGLIKDMGFRWVKQIFAWNTIEGAKKEHYDWSHTDRIVEDTNRYGLKLVVRLDRAPAWAGAQGHNGIPTNFDDFGDFCYDLASRYKGKIHAYQIWNEPNLAREWGNQPPNPREYVRLLSIAYRRIKEADPKAIVISAGLTPTGTTSNEVMPDDVYLEQMYQAGLPQYCDMVGLHGAGFKAPPEISPADVRANPDLYGNEPRFCFRHIEDMRAIMEKYGDTERRAVILEFGWTTDPRPDSPYHWHAVSEEEQADYMVRAYQYAKENWQPWIGLMSLIYIADPYWKEEAEEYWWAITEPNYPETWTRPAYDALKAMAK